MANPYVGEIRMFAGNFPPQGWLFCDGSLLPISQFEVLFTLIGSTYGGDGQQTFGLPDLRGRVPIHQGQGAGLSNRTIGSPGGVEMVTLNLPQIPNHAHALQASTDSASPASAPVGSLVANAGTTNIYAGVAPSNNMSTTAVGAAGGSQPHNNLAPYQCVSYIISLFGIFPSQN